MPLTTVSNGQVSDASQLNQVINVMNGTALSDKGAAFYLANPSLGAAGAAQAIGGGTGGAGNGAVPSQIFVKFATSFNSGTLQSGTTTTSAVVPGDQTAYVGYYFVAVGQAGASVPIVSAVYGGANTTLTISAIVGLASGQSYEISLWPGGTAGRARSAPDSGTAIVYKPAAGATTVWQIGSNLGLFQRDIHTLYLYRFDGTGANGDHLADLKVADLGCDALENNGTTVTNGSPNSTEPAGVDGELIYNGADFKMFRDNLNSPRSKSFEVKGTTGQTSLFAAAASGGVTKINSPKHRLVGTYWNGSITIDDPFFLQDVPIDTAGVHELQVGVDTGTGRIRALTAFTANVGVTLGSTTATVFPAVHSDGSNMFIENSNGPIFLRPIASSNNYALIGSAINGQWVTKDAGGADRVILDNGSGTIITKASASANAGFNLPHGAAPSAPNNGDMWSTTAGLFIRVNGVTKTVTLT